MEWLLQTYRLSGRQGGRAWNYPTGTIERHAREVRLDTGTACGADPHLQVCPGGGNYEKYNRGFCYWRGWYAYRNSREINIIFG